jgi:hypothetical protein
MRLFLAALIVLVASPVMAQTIRYEMDWYFVGANAPFQQGSVLGDDGSCVDGAPLPPIPPGNVVNPGTAHLQHDWDLDGDDDLCSFDITQTVRPFLPGDYFGRAKAISVADPLLVSGGSADSNPFSNVATPADPQGLVITRN